MNISEVAAAAVVRIWDTIPDQLTDSTLRDVPTTTHDTESGLTVVSSWAEEIPLSAFIYGEGTEETEKSGKEGMGSSVPKRTAMAIVRRVDTGDVTALTDAAELVAGSTVWQITGYQSPPGGAIFILSLRK